MDMMTRRRAMMAGIALPEWDVEWDYTMGLPTTVPGFSLLSSGTGSITMTESGLYIRAGSSSSAYRYYTLLDYGCTTGVMEAVLTIPSESATANRAFGFLQISNTTEALRCYFFHSATTDKLRLDNGSELKGGTGVFDFSYDTEMTVRLEIDNGVGQIYLDGVLKKSGITLSSLKTPRPPRFGNANGGSSQSGAVWKSAKFKIGRL